MAEVERLDFSWVRRFAVSVCPYHPLTGTDVMSLCNSRATWAAVGGGDGYMAHLPLRRRSISASLTIALEDQAACPIPAKGALTTLAGE